MTRVQQALRNSPAVALLGPRQCGKTTLARQLAAGRRCEYFDLEDPRDLARLAEPMLALESLRGLVVIDEVQRKPDLFEVLRVLIDRTRPRKRFLLLGSASPYLVRATSESLAGRISFVDMGGFRLDEVGPSAHQKLWLRGGLPRAFLARGTAASLKWREDFTRTFLERDIPQLGITVPAATLRRFWTMLAHYHGQVWNAAELARSLGQSEKTARRYLDILSGAYMVRQLPPWHENIRKRQVKSPKIFLRDSGLLHSLLAIDDRKALLGHPKLGASWEGFAIEQTLSLPQTEHAYFWATHTGPELDLLILRRGKRIGFEFKHSDGPKMTRSMHTVMELLKLDRLYVVYPGPKSYAMAGRTTALSIKELQDLA